MASNVYSLPINSIIPTAPPIVEAEVPKVAAALGIISSAFSQLVAVFVRFCGVSPMPPGLWSALDNSDSTIIAGNLTRFYATASVAIAQGEMINIFLSGGKLKIRKAKADVAGTECDGFCSAAPIAAGAVGEVMLRRGLATVAGPLVVGTRYWLSATVAGGLQTTKPVAAGNVEQYLGMAITTTTFFMDSNSWVQH